MHPYYDRLTDMARKSLRSANEEARRRQTPLVNKFYIAWGLMAEHENIAMQILENLSVNTAKLRYELEENMKFSNYRDHKEFVPYSEDGAKCLVRAIEAHIKMKVKFLGCHHLLLALLEDDDDVSKMFLKCVTKELVCKEIEKIVI